MICQPNLYKLLPHMAWNKIEYLKNDSWPEVLAEKTGRAVVKSVGNIHIHLADICMNFLKGTPIDILYMTYEENSIANTVASDFRAAIAYGDWGLSLEVRENLPATNKKWIDICWGDMVSRIWFQHGAGGKYLNIKGWRPYPTMKEAHSYKYQNRWKCLHFYEMDNFSTWEKGDVAHCWATLSRGGDCDPNFHIIIEQNEPRPGSPGVWTQDYFDTKAKEQQLRLKLREKFPDNEGFKRDAFVLNTYSLEDMTRDELYKFTSEVQRTTLVSMRVSDKNTFDWVYLGKPVALESAVYKNLKLEKHYGIHKDFKPDFLTIGVDIGNLDACCAVLRGFELPDDRNDNMYRTQDGIMVAWHSQRWNESFSPDPDISELTPELWGSTIPTVHQDKDISSWVFNDLVSFIRQALRAFPYKTIKVFFEYADFNSGRYIGQLEDIFAGTTAVIMPNWYKGKIQNRILCESLQIGTKGVYKCCNAELWQAKTSLHYKDVHEQEDKEPAIADQTSKRENKFFDLCDASFYNMPDDLQNEITSILMVVTSTHVHKIKY